MTDNSMILIPLKAIVTLFHCHNHIFVRKIKESSTTKENVCNKTENYKSFENHGDTENYINITHTDKFYNPNSSSSSEVSVTIYNCKKNYTDLVEEVVLCESENNKFVVNENIQKKTIDNDEFELSEEFDDYILVENVNTENALCNNDTDNENELHQLLLDYDNVNEKMIRQFQSNPKYFMSAIKMYTLAIRNKLTSKESLSTVLNSFGKF